jgi:hypothetical protein
MRLLKPVSACLVFVCFFACKSQGPLTPAEAYYSLRDALRQGNAAAFESLLSSESLKKARELSSAVRKMNSKQLEYLSAEYGAGEDRLRRLSLKDFVALYIAAEKRNGGALWRAVSSDILSVQREGQTAQVRTRTGIEIVFIKEGPYWKLDWMRF